MENNNITFNKYVSVNDSDILLAIREGVKPMQFVFDYTRNGLPYFGCDVAGHDKLGNSHNPYFSLSHTPGRWLDALLNAQQIPSIKVDDRVIDNLTKWAIASVRDGGIGLPAKIDLETMQITKQCLLHNLREVMHAFCALYQYRSDEDAKKCAISVIETVDRYYVNNNFLFDESKFLSETGGTVSGINPFPQSFGRYIGTLVKFYRASNYQPALTQAIKLKDYCLENILQENNEYNEELLGDHTHSVTSMVSSLALLGETTGDTELLKRVVSFLDKGLGSCTLDFGWCLVGYKRDYLVGEVNNTSDIMETCFILAKAGFEGYYARAERILRAHFLPSQLLDTHFIEPMIDENKPDSYMLHKNVHGAFGFPCPYGHEYEEGSRISFNWDVVGGAVSGLCTAYNSIISRDYNRIDINMLFDYYDEYIDIRSPYHDNILTILNKKATELISVRIPSSFKVKLVSPKTIDCKIDGDYIVLANLNSNESIQIEFDIEEYKKSYTFRNHKINILWKGESVIGMTSAGKRLCFFPEID